MKHHGITILKSVTSQKSVLRGYSEKTGLFVVDVDGSLDPKAVIDRALDKKNFDENSSKVRKMFKTNFNDIQMRIKFFAKAESWIEDKFVTDDNEKVWTDIENNC